MVLVLIIDQWSKFWIKTNMEYGAGFDILGISWARIQFVENEGMAFGLSYGGVNGKYVLSTFRIIMAGFLGYILYSLWKSGKKISAILLQPHCSRGCRQHHRLYLYGMIFLNHTTMADLHNLFHLAPDMHLYCRVR